MNELNKIRSTIHPISSVIGVLFAAAALLKFAGVLRIGASIQDLALIAISLLIL
jgi:hypothetical protein